MDNLEKLTKKRKKIVKVSAALLVIYGICALVFFVLNTLDVIDVFEMAEKETSRIVELTTIGTCVVGVLTGILCLAKVNSPGWYGILNVFCTCTVILHAFIGISHGSNFGSFEGLVIVYIELIFACIAGTTLYKLKGSQTKLEE